MRQVYVTIICTFGVLLLGCAVLASVVRRGRLEVCVPVWRGLCECPPVELRAHTLLRSGKPQEGNGEKAQSVEALAAARGLELGGDDADESQAPTSTPLLSLAQVAEQYKEQAGEKYRGARACLFVGLFAAYVAVCTLVPHLTRGQVSCGDGFFWETHVPFLLVGVCTKAAEVVLYAFDPSVDGEVPIWKFLFLFVPSFLGYLDAYQDATSIEIADACARSSDPDVNTAMARTLSSTMFYTYYGGVVVLQWGILGAMALTKDTSFAIRAKLLHMDALAACITVPEEDLWLWRMINATRTCFEDVPQAVQQLIFVVQVKRNWFMVISIVGSVLCSCKALYDASVRLAQAQGLLDKAKQLEVVVSVDMKYEGRSGGGWPTSCLIEANGIEHEFAFHPGYTHGGARVVTKRIVDSGGDVPQQMNHDMSFTPAKGVYHHVRVTLRASGKHTFEIVNGEDARSKWSMDFACDHYFSLKPKVTIWTRENSRTREPPAGQALVNAGDEASYDVHGLHSGRLRSIL